MSKSDPSSLATPPWIGNEKVMPSYGWNVNLGRLVGHKRGAVVYFFVGESSGSIEPLKNPGGLGIILPSYTTQLYRDLNVSCWFIFMSWVVSPLPGCQWLT